MNKRLLSILLAILTVLSMLPVGAFAAPEESSAPTTLQVPVVEPAMAEPAEEKESLSEFLPIEQEPHQLFVANFHYSVLNGAAYVTGISSYQGNGETELTIPEEINGYPVKGLQDFYCSSFRHLILPDSVEVIAGGISGYQLKKLTVGAGLKSMDQSKIDGAYSLESIEISDANPNMKSMDGIVYNKEGDTVLAFPLNWGDTYTIPGGVKNIDVILAVNGVKVVYPENGSDFITEDGVVYNSDKTKIMTCDTSKAGKFVMPETVKEIAPQAFYLCTALTEVEISPNVTEISYAAFADCTCLKQITLPQGLKSIGDYAFGKNTALESIVLPEGLTEIGESAFIRCTNLTTVNLPGTLITIGASAFYGNSKQTAELLVIPASVTEIGWSAFANTGYVALDLSAGKARVGGAAFKDCASLVSVKIGENQFDGGEVFGYCQALKNVDLGNTITNITYNMFRGCTALEEMTLPASVTSIEKYAFSYCNKLAKLDVKGVIVYIGEGAFYHSGIADLSFLENSKISYVNRYAFRNTQASSAVLPETVTAIGYKSFMDSKKLASLDIPESVISMCGKSMLGTAWYEAQPDGAVYLEHVMLEYKGNSIPEHHVVIPEGIRVIGDYALAGKRNVTALTLGKDVQYVGDFAFFYSGIRNIDVHPDNPYYSSKEGMLYNKEGTRLIYAPIDQVELTSASYKQNYQTGDRISVNDFSLSLTYRDGSTGYYSYEPYWDGEGEDFEFGKVNMLTPGEKTIPIHFGSHTVNLPITVEGEALTAGDVDGNPGVDMDDAIHVLFYCSFPDEYPVNQNLDFDGSGEVDMDDAIYLLFYCSFPDEYPLL
ncbi:MAG: leucine-rich repeat domain-containing protein [Clostridia bacterium]|nr:leucine-rich repeat domain-containing protein [Clostridia bacterium]